MTDLTNEELRKLAEVATPGPWTLEHGASVGPLVWVHSAHGGPRRDQSVPIAETDLTGSWLRDTYPNAAYIAAASPERILALLDEVDHLLEMHVSLLAIRPTRGELRDENERLRADVGQWQRLAEVRNDQVHELINETMDLEAENERLRDALEQLKDYFDLGEVVFEVSGRFVHAEKLINDTLANEKEATSA